MKNEDKKKLLLDLSCQMNWSNSRQISKEKSGTQNNVKIIRTGNLSKTLTRSGIGENNKSKNTSQSTNFNNYNLNNVVTPKQLNLISLKYPVPHSKIVSLFSSNLHPKNTKKSNKEIDKDKLMAQSYSLKSIIERKCKGLSTSPNNKQSRISLISEQHDNAINKNSSTPLNVCFRSLDFKVNTNHTSPASEVETLHTKSNSVNLGCLNDSKKNNNIVTLPTSDSTACKTTIQSDGNVKESLIFNTIYSKLLDYKTNTVNKDFDSFAQYFVKVFDCVSYSCDSRYKKVSDLIKTILIDFECKNKRDMESMKSNIEEKDKQIKSINDYMEKLNRDNQNFDNQIKTMKKQIKTLKINLNSLSEENKTFKNSIKDYVSELEFLREKEMKMMEVMYILKNKGVQFDDIIKEAANARKYRENLTEESVTSNATVYFPDKISMSTSNLNKQSVYIPPLNFSNIPSYDSEDDKKKIKNK